MNHWLLKSEPDVFGIDDLARAPKRTTGWEGVRNYQARNMLRDDFRKGDRAFFITRVVRFRASPASSRWCARRIPTRRSSIRRASTTTPRARANTRAGSASTCRLETRFEPVITLPELREHASGALRDMIILKRGNRLSVTPVSAAEWRCIVALRR